MALTWQNVSPSNPAGILQAGNMAAANIAKGLDVVGSSMQEYAGDAKDAETGKLLLMLDNAKDRNARQDILNNFDMDYVDRDIIAKDNQEFEAVEQQKADVLFSQGIQTDAAEAEKAQNLFERQKLLSGEKRDIDAKAFIRKQTLGQQQRDITRDATTAQHRVSLLENAAKEAELKLKQYTEGLKHKTVVTKRDTDHQQRMYEQRLLAEKNAETARAENEARNLLDDQRKKTIFDQGQTLWTEEKQLKDADKLLVKAALPKIKEANDINTLTELRKDYRDARLSGSARAQSIIDSINAKIVRIIDVPSLFAQKDGVTTPTMRIEGTTHAAQTRSHNANLQRTVGKLKTILPNSSDADLNSMATTVLSRLSDDYRKAMEKLKVLPEELNTIILRDFKDDLREMTEDEDGLTTADMLTLRQRFINKERTPDNEIAIEAMDTILNTRFKENFTKTSLGTLLSNVDKNVLKVNMEVTSAAGKVDGVVDKKRVIAKHDANVQNLVNLLSPAYINRLTTEEIKKKVTEELLTDPAYAKTVKNAGVTHAADLLREKNKSTAQFVHKIGKAKTAEDLAGIIDFAASNDIQADTSMFVNKISKIALKDTKILDEVISINPTKFDFNKHKQWEREKIRSIKDKYEYIPDGTVQKMLNNIVDNNPNLKKALKSYNELQAYSANLQERMNELTTDRRLDAAAFNLAFQEAPVRTLTDYVLSSPSMKVVQESLADTPDDLQDTISNALRLTNHVYITLKGTYKKDTPEQLGKKAKRVLSAIHPENETLGNEYTVHNWWGKESFPDKNKIIKLSKATSKDF